MKLPKHIELSIEHNPHAGNYETVAEHLDRGYGERFDFISVEERDAAIRTNELWVMQWYPSTPIGFKAIATATLEALLAEAARLADEESR